MKFTRNSRLASLLLLVVLLIAPIIVALQLSSESEDEQITIPSMESLIRIRPTHYAIPANSMFVATDGIDNDGCGGESSPCRSIRYAAHKAFVDTTLVIRAGTYHEYVDFNRRLILQPFPGEEVWLDGSQEVNGWQADGAVWRHDDWQFLWTDDAGKPIGEQIEGEFIDPAHPMAGWPDMVFRNGLGLQQVGSKAEVGPGTFFVDYDERVLYIGDDPADNLIEAATLPLAMQVYDNANGTIIRGLGFRRYANPIRFSEGAMLHLHASSLRIENNTFAQSASAALSLNYSADSVIRGNIFVANGSLGAGAFKTEGQVFEENYLAYNNVERFTYDWESGGAKMIGVRHATIRDNIFARNWGTGFWCDISCSDVTIVRNVVQENEYNGIHFEISAVGVVGSNLVVRNKENGIMISGSNRVQVVNNTLVRNRRNIGITDDERQNTDAAEIAEGITWNSGEIDIYNNLLSGNDGTSGNMDEGSNLLMISNYADGGFTVSTGASMIGILDHNAYFRTDPAQPADLVSLWTGAEGTPRFWNFLPDLPAMQQADNGFEQHGIAGEAGTENPWFASERDGDYRLADDAAVRYKGRSLDAGLAAAINSGLEHPVIEEMAATPIGAIAWASFDVTSETWSNLTLADPDMR